MHSVNVSMALGLRIQCTRVRPTYFENHRRLRPSNNIGEYGELPLTRVGLSVLEHRGSVSVVEATTVFARVCLDRRH